MKPEQQRIAIAEACGWTDIAADYPVNPDDGDFYILWPSGVIPGKQEKRATLPDYLNDLNAMHEAEKVLTWQQTHEYAAHLIEIVGRDKPRLSECADGKPYAERWTWHATAAQRAEAFLRAIGKWTLLIP